MNSRTNHLITGILPMKRSYAFSAAALACASVPRTLLLFFALFLPVAVILLCDSASNTAPAAPLAPATPNAEPQRQPGRQSPELSVVAQIGRRIFFDPSLSGSGQLSCASCHSPANAYGPPNRLAEQRGGRDLRKAGLRATPSLTYIGSTPTFTIGPNSNIADNDQPPQARIPAPGVKVASVAKADAAAAKAAHETVPRGSLDWASGAMAALAEADETVPRGGLDWDGRATTIQSQALGSLLDPNGMGNSSVAEVLDHIKRAPYAEDLKQLFGPTLFEQPALALDEALFAVVRYQLEEPSFHPYDSKYDAYLAGKAKLSEAEARGLKLFEDPHKGNCSSCHIDRPSRDGRLPPAFTDYQFEALGAPRNENIPANSDPNYYDLGLCGPSRKDYADTAAYCGLFKTPSLRNVAMRKVFFHNGVFHSLEEVVHFYVERETTPGKWYPRLANGEIDRYNDLPSRYRQNIDVVDAPFDRKEGDEPALNEAEIADVIAFLKTLTDGYQSEQPDDSTTRAAK
jgi:cytochrome c peroxidase